MEPPEEENLDFKKYLRGKNANLEAIKDKKLRGQLAFKEELYGKSAKAAAKIEKWLLPSEGGFLEAEGIEKTWGIKQESILREVDLLSSRKAYDIVLPDFGPYALDYTANGRHMVVAGRKGHIAVIDTQTLGLRRETQVRETVRDVAVSPIHDIVATAQKKYVYLYDMKGMQELHCLKEHLMPTKLQFLKNFMILASVNKLGQLHYQDITTGEMVANNRTHFGRCDILKVNQYNAIVGLGHTCGKVTLWNPTSSKPLVTMLSHHGCVSSIAFHNGGNLMATAGVDKKIKLWDLRKYEVISTHAGHAKTMDFSQKGLLAHANGSLVQIWKPQGGCQDYGYYMKHSMVRGYQIGDLSFQPYEDVLTLGHSMGFSSILVPGSGEPNYDTFVANPYETKRQRQEREVHVLLDKLQPEMISLDPTNIGSMRPTRREANEGVSKHDKEAQLEEAVASVKSMVMKHKTKGRSKPSKVASKKKDAIIRAKRPFFDMLKDGSQPKKQRTEVSELPYALQRFVRK